MPRNIRVLDAKPRGGLATDTRPRNSLVLDLKPRLKTYGETVYAQTELFAGMSIGPGWYMYVTYPTYSAMRVN